jgi:hypothetical protein
MLKWGITIETLKMMKLDAVIQVKSLKKNYQWKNSQNLGECAIEK